ncbi:carboxypeptidase [Solibacillus merdavium]|uniref:Carboxypeptidase n=1 Tax=Solibacillus merdavium TaxID=2762218 RepID=A0ABR8XQJ0_9BACL|nr:carboxypeptidase [Solibacillus merdavium]MBD8034205.1 carboxypeptidase [Solibacillus merdavium]
MKNIIFVLITFILSYWGISSLGGFIFPSNDENSATSASSLQAAVTFGGVNYLNVFIYIILAMILTTIIFFSVKSRRAN